MLRWLEDVAVAEARHEWDRFDAGVEGCLKEATRVERRELFPSLPVPARHFWPELPSERAVLQKILRLAVVLTCRAPRIVAHLSRLSAPPSLPADDKQSQRPVSRSLP